ncbi:MAG: MBL fold metallo-hydrolase [Bacteroidetes bacterium]|nr:MBL fold metallo-hydrolase [Bacteroidota bacterium]
MKIGNYEVVSVETGRFRLDGGAMFGTIPKVLWENQIPADQSNRIEMALRTLLIRGNGRTILIDTGMGDKWDDKQKGMYHLSNETYTLENSLKAEGLTTDDITDVILTHLHFDHAGGATKIQNGEIIPAFPNATYYIQKSNLDWARNPNERERASYLAVNFEPLIQQNKLVLVDGETEILPGIRAIVSNGHTIGMQCIQVEGDGESLVYCADLIPTSAHIPVPWIMGYDIQPMLMLEEKKKLLNQAVEENWTLFFEHDPAISACKVVPGKKYAEKGEIVRI